jgi:DNA-binding NarL/FixJ family response regulator
LAWLAVSRAALSGREQQVLAHISKGLTNKEIAEEPGVTIKTIKYYVTQVFKKLQVTNRMQPSRSLKD